MDLESQRRGILESIAKLERVQAPEEQNIARIREMKQAYNQISEDIRRESPRFDPFVKLPLELCTNVLKAATYDPDNIFDSNFRFETLSNFMLVSKGWYECIVETPMLWSYIKLCDRYRGRQDDMLDMFLRRSKGCKIHLSFESPLKSWEALCTKIAAHRARIGSIWWWCHYSTDIQLPKIIRIIGPLRHLTKIYGYDYDIDWLLEQGSPLQDVDHGLVSMTTLSLPGAQNLRKFRIQDSVQKILRMAHNIPFAESVYLGGEISSSHVNPVNAGYINPENILSTMPKTLPWQALSYNDPNFHFPVWLMERMPQLVELSLQLSLEEVVPFVRALSLLNHLEILDISFFNPSDIPIAPQDIPLSPSVEVLRLATRHFDSIPSKFLGPPIALFIKCLPHVRSLSLTGSGIGSCYLKLGSTGFQRLEELSIRGEGHLFGEIDPPLLTGNAWFPQSLQSLTILRSNCTPAQFYCSTLRKLHFSMCWGGKEPFDLLGYPQLTNFYSSTRSLPSKKVFHQNLRQLHLATRSTTMEEKNIITRLCRNIALQPSDLPSLESIIFGETPEWDIFFIMLERKNFCLEAGVNRIIRLRLPAYHEEFRQPLSDLLNGVYSERPSNYELSITRSSDAIFDTSM